MIRMDANFTPVDDKFSPSLGLLNYQWSDSVLQAELQELELAGRAASRPQTAPLLDSSIFFGGDDEPLKESANEEDRRKRSRAAIEQASLETFLKDMGHEDEQEAAAAREEAPRLHAEDKGKRSAPSDAVAAAKTKAGRERARRERLNESFAELARVLEPGKAAKSDKSSIITDAIRIVTQLRAENGQLRQLNKFLEERVGTVEKQKSELLMQQALMQQQQAQQQQQQHAGGAPQMGPAHTQMLPPGHFAPGLALGQPVQGMPAGQMGGGLPYMQAGLQQHDIPSSSSSGLGLLPLSPTSAMQSGSGRMPDFQAGGVMPGGSGGNAGGGMVVSGMPAMAPMRWLPAATMDTSQDSLRRPPAA